MVLHHKPKRCVPIACVFIQVTFLLHVFAYFYPWQDLSKMCIPENNIVLKYQCAIINNSLFGMIQKLRVAYPFTNMPIFHDQSSTSNGLDIRNQYHFLSQINFLYSINLQLQLQFRLPLFILIGEYWFKLKKEINIVISQHLYEKEQQEDIKGQCTM